MAPQTLQPAVQSPWPEPPLPAVDLTTHVLRHSPALGDRPALVDAPSGRTISYGALTSLVRRAATGLAARGFENGDVLAVHAPNLPEYAIAVHAAISLGGTVTTSNPLCTAGELAHQLTDSRARMVVTVPPFLEAAREATARAGCEEPLVFGEAEGATPFSACSSMGTGRPRWTSSPTKRPPFSIRAAPPACPRASS